MKSKVYIVCEPSLRRGDQLVPAIDLTPAAEWGEIIILLNSPQSFISPEQTIKVLRDKMSDFCDDDFLVPVGDPALMCAVAMVASHINGGRVKMLKWDRRVMRYFPIAVNITEGQVHA